MLAVALIWGTVVTLIAFLGASCFEKWICRKYPYQQSVWKDGPRELRVTDSEQLYPLAKKLGLVNEKPAESTRAED